MFIINTSITLKDITPKISRNLQVPSDLTLDQFHETIQKAMGWTNTHLYLFQLREKVWGIPESEQDFIFDSRETTIAEFLQFTGSKNLDYVYDYGDSWDHSVYFGKQDPPVAGELYPKLTKARGHAPFEDCGGAWGYMAILKKLADPSVEIPNQEAFEFYPADWNPEEVNFERLQEMVADYAKFVRSPEYARKDPFDYTRR